MGTGIIIYDCMDTFICCTVEKDKWCEQMVSEHMLVYISSGEMDLIAPEKTYHLKKGEAFFVKRSHLLRKIKHPAKNGEPFKGLSLQLKRPFLKKLLDEQQVRIPLTGNLQTTKSTCVMLEKSPFINGLFTSLEQYVDSGQYPSKELMESKLREATFALLQLKPELASVLFDFIEPWKINIEDFMNKNYKCNLSIEEFAHYTGRSLSLFKKDFERIFHTTPGRWIVKRRLEEAKMLMEGFGKKPADIYMELGFKSLSHFSTAFKKEYGFPPSSLVTEK